MCYYVQSNYYVHGSAHVHPCIHANLPLFSQNLILIKHMFSVEMLNWLNWMMCSKIYHRIRGWLVDTYIVVKLLLFIKLFTFGDRDFRLEKLQFFVQIVFTYIHTTCIHISLKKKWFQKQKRKEKKSWNTNSKPKFIIKYVRIRWLKHTRIRWIIILFRFC